MIPLTLTLRNFMCYRGGENQVDFRGIHLACLAGDNGQGKSALLDAMTWALWGKSRVRRDDDLISFGEQEMEVTLDFDLAGDHFRVIRRRSAKGRGSSLLELQMRSDAGHFLSHSGGTISETQSRIIDLLRLDYDTFVNSAFLIQGRADEFTTRRPGQRKQILGEILSLRAYDGYADRAKTFRGKAQQRVAELERELVHVRDEAEQIDALQAEVIDAEAQANQLRDATKKAVERHQAALDRRRELDEMADRRTAAEREAQALRGQIARSAETIESQRRRLAGYDALLARAETIEAEIAELQAARELKEKLDELRDRNSRLQSESATLRESLERARGALEADLRVAQNECRNFEKAVQKYAPLEASLDEARRQVQQLEGLRQARAEQQQQLVTLNSSQGELSNENGALKKKMEELRKRMDVLEATGEEAACPVCRQPLDPETRRRVLAESQDEGGSMATLYRENQSALRQVGQEIARVEAEIAAMERELKELGRWQQKESRAAEAATEMVAAREGLEASRQKVAALQARLEAGDFAPEIQGRLAALAGEGAAIGYDAAAHQQTRQVIQRLAPRHQEHTSLAQARRERPETESLVRTLSATHETLVTRRAEQEALVTTLTAALAAGDAVRQEVITAQAEVTRLQSEGVVAQRHLGAARQRLEFAERAAARLPEVEKEVGAAREEAMIFQQLVDAFGRRGVQAMIIESALPELEGAANEILGRMTDGRMSVSLVTQRESRAGDSTIETLDIVIADEYGARPYETFSGGEAFRINFALRIALSKLLAHRAGTSLRTLIVDEGFGSQDAQGRERLVEAITHVQDDFDRILVITHIESLKNAFPVRIDVTKDADGSRVTIH